MLMSSLSRVASLSLALSLALALLAGPAALPAEAAAMPLQAPAPSRYGLPDFAQLAEQVGTAVVNISVVQQQRAEAGLSPDDPFYDFLRRFGIPAPGMPGGPRGGGNPIARGIGSGFIVSADGYILTNAHVVEEAAEVTVRLTDKRELKAKVVGADKRTDVALIKVEASGLPVVRIGDPDQARVGEWVVAVGSPFGFENSVTAGIISAKARRLPDETYVPFLQTDVAINPGNSGGPLFNLGGEVIGINSQIYSRSGGFMGISFAIPIDVAMKVKDQLQRHGKVERGRLGVAIQGLDKELAQSFGLEEAAGALVANVEEGSPADKAGLKAGDVVLGVNGAKVTDSTDLPRIIGDMRPGSAARLQVWRDRKSRDLTVTLGAQQAEESTAAARPRSPRTERQNTGKLGLSGRALSAQEARQLGVAGGLLVEETGGPAARAGIQAGDVILALNNQPVTGVEQFRNLLEQAGDRYALLVQRGSGRIYVPIKLK
jgi:serine protease Do